MCLSVISAVFKPRCRGRSSWRGNNAGQRGEKERLCIICGGGAAVKVKQLSRLVRVPWRSAREQSRVASFQTAASVERRNASAQIVATGRRWGPSSVSVELCSAGDTAHPEWVCRMLRSARHGASRVMAPGADCGCTLPGHSTGHRELETKIILTFCFLPLLLLEEKWCNVDNLTLFQINRKKKLHLSCLHSRVKILKFLMYLS